jgi:ketosteroid isomerase-like protein
MAQDDDLARRIDRLEARAEIGELVSAYAIACDEHDMARLTGLFTADAVFDSPSRLLAAEGREAIAAMFVKLFDVRGPAFHWTHDRFVAFDDADPDRATGLVLSHAETTPNNVVSVAAMKYEDVYRREAGRWLFARRTIHFLYYVPVTEYARALNSEHRLAVGAERRPADYPENLAAWQAFDRVYGRSAAGR